MLPVNEKGLNAQEMLEKKLAVYFLHGLDLDHDFINPGLALEAFSEADIVVSFSTYMSDILKKHADLILPVAAFSEYSGSFINCSGLLQNFDTAVLPLDEAKPGWKIYKVLGSMLNIPECDFGHCSEITKVLSASLPGIKNKSFYEISYPSISSPKELFRVGHWPANRVDAMVRRSKPLQAVHANTNNAARVNSKLADKLGIIDGKQVLLSQDGEELQVNCLIDDNLADDCIWLTTANDSRANLRNASGVISFLKVID